MGLPRPQAPGTAHDLISRVLHAVGRAEVADLTGATASVQSHWTDPEEVNGRRMPVVFLHRLARVSESAAREVAEDFAALAGGMFMPLPDPKGDLGQAGAEAAREFADVMTGLMASLGPGSKLPGDLTPEEARTEDREIGEAIDALARLRAVVRVRLREGAE